MNKRQTPPECSQRSSLQRDIGTTFYCRIVRSRTGDAPKLFSAVIEVSPHMNWLNIYQLSNNAVVTETEKQADSGTICLASDRMDKCK